MDMLLKDLLRLRRDEQGDAIPIDVLLALRMPMPRDVLEQFVLDHGTKYDFQIQYGEIDLHAIAWEPISMPTVEILGASIYPRFAPWVESVADRTKAVAVEGWSRVQLAPEAIRSWRDQGTWNRRPIFVRGGLIGSDRSLHLVEGHTRCGALRGLVETGALPGTALHDVWIGSTCESTDPGELWKEVARAERIQFLPWLIGRMSNHGDLGEIASKLSAVVDDLRHFGTLKGHDLLTVLEIAGENKELAARRGRIREAHAEWERFTNQ